MSKVLTIAGLITLSASGALHAQINPSGLVSGGTYKSSINSSNFAEASSGGVASTFYAFAECMYDGESDHYQKKCIDTPNNFAEVGSDVFPYMDEMVYVSGNINIPAPILPNGETVCPAQTTYEAKIYLGLGGDMFFNNQLGTDNFTYTNTATDKFGLGPQVLNYYNSYPNIVPSVQATLSYRYSVGVIEQLNCPTAGKPPSSPAASFFTEYDDYDDPFLSVTTLYPNLTVQFGTPINYLLQETTIAEGIPSSYTAKIAGEGSAQIPVVQSSSPPPEGDTDGYASAEAITDRVVNVVYELSNNGYVQQPVALPEPDIGFVQFTGVVYTDVNNTSEVPLGDNSGDVTQTCVYNDCATINVPFPSFQIAAELADRGTSCDAITSTTPNGGNQTSETDWVADPNVQAFTSNGVFVGQFCQLKGNPAGQPQAQSPTEHALWEKQVHTLRGKPRPPEVSSYAVPMTQADLDKALGHDPICHCGKYPAGYVPPAARH